MHLRSFLSQSLLYRTIFNLYGKAIYRMSTVGGDGEAEPRQSVDCETQPRPCGMCIVTVAFNRPDMIRTQIKAVMAHVKDEDYEHVVVDNSSDRSKRPLIRDICRQEGIRYYEVPWRMQKWMFPKIFFYGYSHGMALNWMFSNVLKSIRPERFALIDHDLFPTKDVSLTEMLADKDFVGVGRVRNGRWYLWPGLSIYRYDVAERCEPNFLPVYVGKTYLDAGGAMYLRLFENYDLREQTFIPSQTIRIKQTRRIPKNDVYHMDCIQRIGNGWIHVINGSNYVGLKEKERVIKRVLEKVEEGLNTDRQ